jgi:hypothetical protein
MISHGYGPENRICFLGVDSESRFSLEFCGCWPDQGTVVNGNHGMMP